MVSSIPKWIMERYSILWKKYGIKEINYEEIKKTLTIDDLNIISVFLSELRRAGWLEVRLDPEDSRRRIYRLRPPEQVRRPKKDLSLLVKKEILTKK